MKVHHRMAAHHKRGGKAHKAKGGEIHHEADHDSLVEHGMREWEEDERSNPEERDNAAKIFGEAEKKKHGGRAKRKHGGRIHKHHEAGKHLAHAKHVGHVKGHHGKHHAGKMPRGHKAGGGSNMNPLSSAHAGTQAKGRHAVDID